MDFGRFPYLRRTRRVGCRTDWIAQGLSGGPTDRQPETGSGSSRRQLRPNENWLGDKPAACPDPNPSPSLPEIELTVENPKPNARPPGVPADAQEATVVRHEDGDTFTAEGGTLPSGGATTVRVLEIDAPERGAPNAAGAEEFIRQALPLGSTIYLLGDKDDVDQFGRYLRYVWNAEGTFFNKETVRQGWAKAVLIPPNDRYISEMRAAEAEAKAARRGIWAVSTTTIPSRVTGPAITQPRATQPRITEPPRTEPPATEPDDGGCHPSYPDFCIPPPPPDLDCGDIGRSFTVRQPDPHRFDGLPGQAGEPDGIGCESYN